MLELDHIFVLAEPGGAAADELVARGFVEGRSNRHVGQGTENRCFFFANAYLEVLWVYDDADVRSPVIAPTRLWERSRARLTGVAPFGVCVRPARALPFATWAYRPPYMPAGGQIDIADTPPHEPLVFATPWGQRPDAWPAERRQPLVHGNGATALVGLAITRPRGTPVSEPMRALEQAGLVTLVEGDAHHLALALRDLREPLDHATLPLRLTAGT